MLAWISAFYQSFIPLLHTHHRYMRIYNTCITSTCVHVTAVHLAFIDLVIFSKSWKNHGPDRNVYLHHHLQSCNKKVESAYIKILGEVISCILITLRLFGELLWKKFILLFLCYTFLIILLYFCTFYIFILLLYFIILHIYEFKFPKILK